MVCWTCSVLFFQQGPATLTQFTVTIHCTRSSKLKETISLLLQMITCSDHADCACVSSQREGNTFSNNPHHLEMRFHRVELCAFLCVCVLSNIVFRFPVWSVRVSPMPSALLSTPSYFVRSYLSPVMYPKKAILGFAWLPVQNWNSFL